MCPVSLGFMGVVCVPFTCVVVYVLYMYLYQPDGSGEEVEKETEKAIALRHRSIKLCFGIHPSIQILFTFMWT